MGIFGKLSFTLNNLRTGILDMRIEHLTPAPQDQNI